MTVLVWLCALLTLALALYATGHLVCVLILASSRRPERVFEGGPSTPTSVLIPARNEGPAAIRVINSLVAQDHNGPVDIVLLLKDRSDTSIPFLAAAYPNIDLGGTAPKVELLSGPSRRVSVAFTGADPKSDKINWASPQITTPLVAILDCDHQAHPDWLRTSACLLEEQGARIVQGCRHPLFTRGFFQLWDSLHQHIGCELFNHAFSKMGLTVFFTGTTLVMETKLLKAHPLHMCITEDVNFSYEILREGVKIIHNPYSGSDEDGSPNLFSFIARRRRWASGHTEAFFRHFIGIFRGPLRWRDKIQFIFHGMHYLVGTGVFALHLVIGLIFLRNLTDSGMAATVGSTLVLAGWIAHTQQSKRWSTWLSEVAVLSIWVFPAVVIAMNLTRAWLMSDFSHVRLPVSPTLQLIGLISLATPLIVLLAGMLRFRQLNLGSFLWVSLSYPLAFYLDLCGVLIGITDFITRRRHWHNVSRTADALEDKTNIAPLIPVNIRESWSIESMVTYAPHAIGRSMAAMLQPRRFVPTLLVLGISCTGVLYSPDTRIPVADLDCEVLEHDGEPWIVPASKMSGYCDPISENPTPRWSHRNGTYEMSRKDNLTTVDTTYWKKLDSTFFCNNAVFSPENIQPAGDGGIHLHLEAKPAQDRQYTSASIATKSDRHLYGRYEVVMKPAKASGVITAFFLYRFDPWQEIDFEFVGKDTTKALINVFYNPGEEGDLYNYGYRGTPVIVDLGFDAADDYHRYAIEWEPNEIRWFVDDKLIHRRTSGQPVPVPHLPMRFHINVWPICSEELAGPLDVSALPTGADVKSVQVSKWKAPPTSGLPPFVRNLFKEPEPPQNWREQAEWIQPNQ